MIKEYELLQDDSHLVHISEVRVLTEETIFVKNADEASTVLKLIFKDFAQEHAYAIALTTVCEVIGVACVGIGGCNFAPVSKVSVLQLALLLNAPLILLAHNHPSSYSFPSEEDVTLTEEIKKCCKLLNVQVADHFVVGRSEYYSISEKKFIGGKV